MRRVPAMSLLPGDACLAPLPGTPMAPRFFDDPALVRKLLDARVEVALALAAAWQLFTAGWFLVNWAPTLTSVFASMNVRVPWPTQATLWVSSCLDAHPLLVGGPLAAAALWVSVGLPWRLLQRIWNEKDTERAERARLRLLVFLVVLNAGLAVAGLLLEYALFTPIVMMGTSVM